MTPPRIVTIMGSGETTATMVPVHRAVLERFGRRPRLALLDTPYGFQENADELTERGLEYFRVSLPMAEVTVASLRSDGDPPLAREQALETLRRADVVFSGPGSPSYALKVWEATQVGSVLAAKLAEGGALTFASAASVTLGRWSLPVYEIYKVGAPPAWLDGLDLLGRHGITAAVVPHWDNAEGGTHDTSRCWVGARRFEALRGLLPHEARILGVDEHTACLLDLEERTMEAAGRGTVTVIGPSGSSLLAPGDRAPLALLQADPPAPVQSTRPGVPPAAASLAGFQEPFAAALEAGDYDAALDAILSLEDAHQAWGEADAGRAHAALRAMVTRFTNAVAGQALDPDARAAAVEVLLEVRARARDEGRWADADAIRRSLLLLAVELRDTPAGTLWEDRSG
jgi:cyanophycinase-like exopeptidase